jgi:MarR-like DNA-binding transcriptional regulator SgrR of sgrS sRNA
MRPNFVEIPIRRYDRISNRILTVLNECDGEFEGMLELALICDSTPRRVNRELMRMQHLQVVSVKRGSGRGNKTRITKI